jgi:hypothetical protein
VSRVNEAGGPRAVDCLRECAVEEDVLDVELVHGSTLGDSQSQHSPDSGRPDNGVEGLIVVYLGALGEPSEDPMRLVLVQRAIRFELVLKDPLVGGNNILRGSRNQVPRDSRASYSSSIARRQWGSVSALRIEVGTGDNVGGAAAVENCR